MVKSVMGCWAWQADLSLLAKLPLGMRLPQDHKIVFIKFGLKIGNPCLCHRKAYVLVNFTCLWDCSPPLYCVGFKIIRFY